VVHDLSPLFPGYVLQIVAYHMDEIGASLVTMIDRLNSAREAWKNPSTLTNKCPADHAINIVPMAK